MREAWFLVAAVLMAAGAQAQEPPEAANGLEAGVRYWASTGSTKRSHDASSLSPLLLNPTSTLVYSDLDANTLELFARKGFAENWFVKGNVGVGNINTGTFTDQDFFISGGRPVMTQTTSAADGKLHYVSIDVGRDVWRLGEATFSLFAGYQQWNERVDGHGLSDSFGTLGLGPGTLVITNDLTWKSWRLGGEMRATRGRTRFSFEAALVPYAKYRNEDSHYLRQSPSDLGPVPNVIATGHGWGGQFEAEVRRSYPELWGLDFGIGARYWKLESEKGTQSQAGFTFPIVELVSKRYGFTLSATKSW
jgi:hypothetical protein